MNQKTKKLNKQNNLLDEQISDENQTIFTDMICYLRSSNISEYNIELVRQDLTEMILSAQKRGEDITTIINGDYKQFCDYIIESLPPKTLSQKILELANIITLCLSILFIINIVLSKETFSIIKSLIKQDAIDWNLSISIGTFVSIFLILFLAVMIVKIITKNAFNESIKYKRALIFFSVLTLILIIIFIAYFGEATLFSINICVALAITVILFFTHKLLEFF